MREFGFELALCAHLEDDDRLVGRQLGAAVHGRRVTDVVLVDPGPSFVERVALTPETIPPAAVESAVGPGRARYWKEAFDCHPETAREATERAAEIGFFERERHSGRTYVRQVARYPEGWFDRLVGVENKPDLDRPGALETQLLTDVRLGLLDEVVLATASHVTGAHENRIPSEVGIWEFDPRSGERTVVREPTSLASEEPGIEILDRDPARTDVRVATAAEKARRRRRIAERVYGKGWRTFEFPACGQISPDESGIPHCRWAGRPVHAPTDCHEACPGREPAAPPDVDLAGLRAAAGPWEPEPPGRRTRQATLDRFGPVTDGR